MKKLCISFLIFLILVITVIGFTLPERRYETAYLRIHIRANSNSETDQKVKYEVKEAVVKYLTPIVACCDTKQKAIDRIKDSKSGIEREADKVLKAKGFDYCSEAKINNELFPTRSYDNLTLESGYYDALIVNLGSGEGDNWWCVVYPPLCFTGEGNGYIYKSKIYEIIDKFFSEEHKEDK